MGFVAGVDNERSIAAPVFVVNEAVNTIDVVRGVGAGEGDPEEIVEGACGEGAVTYDEDEGQTFEGLGSKYFGKMRDVFGAIFRIFEGGAFDGKNAGQGDVWIFESGWQ